LLVAAGGAHAATLTVTSNMAPLDFTNWTSTLDLPKFDAGLGTLDSVTIELFGDLQGSAKAESHNNGPSVITLKLGATLTLSTPGDAALLVQLAQTAPLFPHVFIAASYDGHQDYAGPSGYNSGSVEVLSSKVASFSDGATLALFTGSGVVHAPLTAKGASGYTGSGNIRTAFSTQASAYAQVTYSYAPTLFTPSVVPEPETWALMLGGIGVIGTLSARRRRNV
jgi:hypothetical protein